MSPSPVTRHVLRPGAYHDSVVLMQLQAALAATPGVLDAAVVMATAANRDLLAAADLLPAEAAEAGDGDLLVVVKAEAEAAAEDALAKMGELLAPRRAGSAQAFRPRSLASAVKQLPEAHWVLISVPGRFAAALAREALGLGRNVFLYSDNVPVAEEVALKEMAEARGLLVLGPDCGTALVGGCGLGFANRVRRGAIGVVAASGTGLQAVASRIHELGAGVSQALGTGGRDLSDEVGGATALQALDLLRRDPATRVIALVSKPPEPAVAARLLAAALSVGKPVVVDFLGWPPPGRRLGPLRFATSLSEAAELAVELAAVEEGEAVEATREPEAPRFAPGQRYLRGLFSGGTLAQEALLGLSAVLFPIHSNLASPRSRRLPDPAHSRAHTILDLGTDELTVGRLHPMLDQELRLRRLRQEAADPEVAAVLLDVVLGEGAHRDPAAELAPAIEAACAAARSAGRELAVLALVVGTGEDPQDLAAQVQALREVGARVCTTVGEAVEGAASLLTALPEDAESGAGASEPFALEPVPLEAVEAPIAAVNVGLETFYDSLVSQGARAVHVEWRPPAGGDERLAGILARMRG